MNKDIYGMKQDCFALSTLKHDQLGTISSKKPIQEKHIERHKDSFVTQLDANHIPTEAQKKDTSELLYRLENTDSIRQATQLMKEVVNNLEEMQKNILCVRESYFKVINDNIDSVYGVLVKGYTRQDRDNYIKALVHYSDVLKELNAFLDESVLKKPQLPSLHHSSGMYGDLKALERLRQGKSAELPNLTYNQNRTQFG